MGEHLPLLEFDTRGDMLEKAESDGQPNQAKIKGISVVGLGKLGAPLAAVYASAGFSVLGLDLDEQCVAAINAGSAPVKETGLQDLMNSHKSRMRATTNAADLIAESDVTFIIVPTPSLENGLFSNDFVLAALRALCPALKAKTSRHLIVISSTVMPGTTDREIVPLLEAETGKNVGGPLLGLCYNPEFIALGSVIRNMRNPDIVLIGESDPASGKLLGALHHGICENVPDMQQMSFINAELTKIAINTYVTTKISYANMLAEVCEKLDGADVDIVTHAIGGDSRIGRKYLTGAVKYGGPCFPRDNKAFSAMGQAIGANCALARATDDINDHQTARLVAWVLKFAPEGATLCVAGIAYKPETSETTESQGVALLHALRSNGYAVRAYDPEVNQTQMPGGIEIYDDLLQACEGCAVVILATPWAGMEQDLSQLRNATIIDPWRITKKLQLSSCVTVIHLGVGATAR